MSYPGGYDTLFIVHTKVKQILLSTYMVYSEHNDNSTTCFSKEFNGSANNFSRLVDLVKPPHFHFLDCRGIAVAICRRGF